MTSDLVQNKHSRSKLEHKNQYAHGLPAINDSVGIELTREQNFLEGTHDLFDVLAGRSVEKEGLERSIGATIALLKQAQTTIENAEQKIDAQNKRIKNLEQLTTVDEHTGLSNTLGLYETLKRETARMQRDEARSTLLVLVDLDNAKAIKTHSGYKAHKAALKLIAQILSSEARIMDVAARVNEDEFILMFPNTSVEDTLTRAQQLAKRLNRLSMVWDSREISINVSIGLKSFGPNDTPEFLLNSDKENAERA